jgi:prophage regulatory protein
MRTSDDCTLRNVAAAALTSASTSPNPPVDRASPRLVRFRGVQRKVPYSRASIYRLMKERGFPRPKGLGGRAAFWDEAEVDEWIARRLAARDAGKQSVRAASQSPKNTRAKHEKAPMVAADKDIAVAAVAQNATAST